jgi:hypothetical protein
MKNAIKKLLLAASVLGLTSTVASAAVLDFSEVSPGYQGSNVVNLSNATISTIGPDIFVFQQGEATPAFGPTGGFCGLTAINGDNCATVDVIDFSFSTAISNLMFQSAQYDTGDQASASIYAGATLLDTININSAMLVDFTGYSGVTSLIINDLASTGNGLAYGDFTFTPVPVPAAAWLFGSGLIGLIGVARRKA